MREDGSWLLDGLVPIPDLKSQLGFRSVLTEEKARYSTLAGMLMWLKGIVFQAVKMVSSSEREPDT